MGTRTYRPTAGVRRYLQPLTVDSARLQEDTWERYPGGVPTTALTLVVREASRWSANRQPRALPRGHVRRRGGRQAHYGNSLDLASGTFATNLILLFIVTRCISAFLILLIRTAEVQGACAG